MAKKKKGAKVQDAPKSQAVTSPSSDLATDKPKRDPPKSPLTLEGLAQTSEPKDMLKEDYTRTQNRITETRDLIKANETKISTLKRSLDESGSALAKLEMSLKDLEKAKSSLQNLAPTGQSASHDNPHSPTTSRAASAFIKESASMPEIREMERQMNALTERILELKRIIHGLKMDILQSNTRLQVDQEYLRHLESQKTSLDVVLQRIAKILPSRLLVPSEIWIRIFEYWVRERDSVLIHHALPSPLILGHVCRLWRNVVFSTPNLWTRLDISPPLTSPWSRHNMLQMVERVTEGSTAVRDMQLELFLDQCTSHHFFASASFAPFRRLRIHVGNTTDFSNFKYSWKWCPEALTIRATRTSPPGALQELPIHLGYLGRLAEELDLNVETSTPLDLSPFPRSTLQKLKIQSSSSLLSLWGSSTQMPHLKHLTITPHQYLIIYNLTALNLDALTLLPPIEVQSSFGAFLFKSQEPTVPVVDCLAVALSHKLQRVKTLTFVEWKSTSKAFSCTYALECLLKQALSPTHVRFEGCHLDGTGVISLLRSRSLIKEKSVIVELTLTSCIGVTMAHCKVLESLVGRLHVYL